MQVCERGTGRLAPMGSAAPSPSSTDPSMSASQASMEMQMRWPAGGTARNTRPRQDDTAQRRVGPLILITEVEESAIVAATSSMESATMEECLS